LISSHSPAGVASGTAAKARVRPATTPDVGAIIQLLRAGINARLSAEIWRRIFEYPGASNAPNLGFVLECGERVVGFLGAIYSERSLDHRTERFCNLTSWYTLPDFRSYSLKLLMAVLSQRGYTFTSLTPSPTATKAITAFGFHRLETNKVLFGPSLFRALFDRKIKARRDGRFYKAQRLLEILSETAVVKSLDMARGPKLASLEGRGARLLAGSELVRPHLTPADQEILDDYPNCEHFLVQGQDCYAYAVTIRRKLDFGRRSLTAFLTEILHLSSRNLENTHWQSLCDLIMRNTRSPGILVDERQIDSSYGGRLPIPCNAYFLSTNGISPHEIDNLYTEMPLLDLYWAPSLRH